MESATTGHANCAHATRTLGLADALESFHQAVSAACKLPAGSVERIRTAVPIIDLEIADGSRRPSATQAAPNAERKPRGSASIAERLATKLR